MSFDEMQLALQLAQRWGILTVPDTQVVQIKHAQVVDDTVVYPGDVEITDRYGTDEAPIVLTECTFNGCTAAGMAECVIELVNSALGQEMQSPHKSSPLEALSERMAEPISAMEGYGAIIVLAKIDDPTLPVAVNLRGFQGGTVNPTRIALTATDIIASHQGESLCHLPVAGIG